MHPAARKYVTQFATDAPVHVVEIGSRNINGRVRDLFPNATHLGIDVADGPDVDVVADGATYIPDAPADVVICCEVFEHAANWRDIVANAYRMCVPGGRFIVTAAGPGRRPHSAIDGKKVRDGEWYENVDPDDLGAAMVGAGFSPVNVDQLGPDVRAVGVRP